MPRGPGNYLLSFSSLLAVAFLLGTCRWSDDFRVRLELKRGNQSYLQGNFEKAIEHYDRGLSLHPAHPRLLLNRAYSQTALLNKTYEDSARGSIVAQAVETYRALLPLLPEHDELPSREQIEEHMLTLWIESNQPERAEELLLERISRNPTDSSTLEMLSHVALERNDVDAAMQWKRRRLELQPDDPDLLFATAALAWRLCKERLPAQDPRRRAWLEEGWGLLERALQLSPNHAEAHTYRELLKQEMATLEP